MVKYGLLGDARSSPGSKQNWRGNLRRDAAAREHAVATSCAPRRPSSPPTRRETGTRALLNLGHTFGHALEASPAIRDRLLHGEAIAIGMRMAFTFSERLGLCPPGTAARVGGHLRGVGLPSDLTAIRALLPDAAALLAIMRRDKKARAGEIAFVLVRGIGEAYVETGIPEEAIIGFLADELAMQ